MNIFAIFQVGLKPSALKNELSAAIHFLTFAKRSRNLAVTDPLMNATLENTKDVISQFQEGTLKKINKDRNEKSVRNIQDGLPYSLEDVRRQFEDPLLICEVSRT